MLAHLKIKLIHVSTAFALQYQFKQGRLCSTATAIAAECRHTAGPILAFGILVLGGIFVAATHSAIGIRHISIGIGISLAYLQQA